MLISYKWLQQFISDLDVTPQEFADQLSASLAEVEGYEIFDNQFEGIVVGKIEAISKHPNADKLQVATVTTGKATHTIVCGAPNISVGDYVPTILPGSTLPGTDFTIERREIRGQVSEGMLCSAKELGISQDHSGILLLNNEPNIRVGGNFDTLAKSDDVIFEIENKALTHRPDAFSHIGMAREVAAAFGLKFAMPKITKLPKSSAQAGHSVTVQNETLCRRYSSLEIHGVEIADSPLWLQLRLARLGTRPINNVVDATNYVMLEYGQPTHAFDADKLTGSHIIIRNATEGEILTTLDDTERKLTTDMLVISDEKGPIALAGIMGGSTTEIDNETQTIVLESANFEYFNNRKTSRTLGLNTEANTRFSKNQDPNATIPAIHRIIELLGSTTAKGLTISDLNDTYTEKREATIVPFTNERIISIIGDEEKITPKAIQRILTLLGIDIIDHGGKLGAQIPTFRPDITMQEDLAEEVARIIGYDNLTLTLPTRDLTPVSTNEHITWKRRVKTEVARLGFTEVYNFTFVGKELFTKCGMIDSLDISIKNPISPETTFLRPTLVPQLIENVRDNITAGYSRQMLFELEKGITPIDNDLPKETTLVALAQYAKGVSSQNLFMQTKAHVTMLLASLNLDAAFYVPSEDTIPAMYHPNLTAEVSIDGESVGFVGLINPTVQVNFGFSQPLAITELDADTLFEFTDTEAGYTPVSPHPTLTIDVSCIIDADTSLDNVDQVLMHATSSLVTKVTAIESTKDIEKFGEGKKAVIFRCTFQAPDRTLSKQETAPDISNVTHILTSNFGAEIR